MPAPPIQSLVSVATGGDKYGSPADISISIDKAQLARIREDLKRMPGAAQKVLSRAINDALKAVRTLAAKEIKSRTKIPSKVLKKRVFMDRATTRDPAGKLRFGQAGFAFIHLKPKQTKKGVRISVKGLALKSAFAVEIGSHRSYRAQLQPGMKGRVLEHAFIRTGRRGGEMVLRRGYGGEFWARAPRYPLHLPAIGSFASLVREAGIGPQLVVKAQETLVKRIDANASWILTGKRG